MELKINDKKELKIINAENLLSGNVNSYDLDLGIDESYEDFVITLIYKNGDIIKKSIITYETKSVKIPYEVLEKSGDLVIGLFAEKVENEKLIQRNSANLVYLAIENGSYTGDGTYTEEIDATILQRYLQQMTDYYNSTKEEFLGITEEKKDELNEIAINLEQGINEIAEQGVSQIIDTYTEKTIELEEKIASGEYKGEKGDIGETPDFKIGEVKSISSDSEAQVIITGTKENPILNIFIPRGADGKIEFTVANQLPAEGDSGKIYLIPAKKEEEKNVFDEYIWINSKWEQIGSASIDIDLTKYYTKEEIESILINYIKESDLQSKLTDYVKNTDYATESKGGVVKTNATLGTAITSQGYICGATRDIEKYESAEGRLLISKGTLENVLTNRIGNLDSLLEKLDIGGGV